MSDAHEGRPALAEATAAAYRRVYAAVVSEAVRCLAEANAEAEEGEWPAGQSWSDLGSTSRSTFMRQARQRLGIVDHDAFLVPVRTGAVNVDDLWDGDDAP